MLHVCLNTYHVRILVYVYIYIYIMYILIILLYPEPIFSFWGHRAEHGDTPEGWNWWKSLSFTSCLFILGAICISFLQKQLVFNCFFSGMICLEVQDSKGNKRNCMDVPFTDWSTGRCKLGVFLGLWHGSACVVRREIGPIQYGHKVIEDIGTCNYYSWFFFLGGKSWSPHPLVWQSALYLFCRASPIQFPFGSRGFSKLGTLISPNFGKPLVWGLGTPNFQTCIFSNPDFDGWSAFSLTKLSHQTAGHIKNLSPGCQVHSLRHFLASVPEAWHDWEIVNS